MAKISHALKIDTRVWCRENIGWACDYRRNDAFSRISGKLVRVSSTRARAIYSFIVLSYRKFTTYASACMPLYRGEAFPRLGHTTYRDYANRPVLTRPPKIIITFQLSCFVCNDRDFPADSGCSTANVLHEARSFLT